ncbi:MAG: altronate dehydratase family protein [Saprospiraceae bacterium]
MELKSSMTKILKINPNDNVLVALQDLEQNETIEYNNKFITLPNQVKAKHKFLIDDIDSGENIIMYGVIIGKAQKNMSKGEVLTTKNTIHKSSELSKRVPLKNWEGPDVNNWSKKTFMGYHRKDGSVGTANYWIVFPLVFCENKYIEILKEVINDVFGISKYENYKSIARTILDSGEYDKNPSENSNNITEFPFKNVDGIRFITHSMGCGGTRQDANSLLGLLSGYLLNPNVAGATILGLGCQNAQYSILEEELNKRMPDFDKPISYLDHQTLGTEDSLLTSALHSIIEGVKLADNNIRTETSIDKLIIGLECGASDGFSGISANPVLGQVSDIIVKSGGTSILAEFPELCGVEQELINRCKTDELAERFIHLMDNYEKAAIAAGSSFDMNPSPGNIKDGLITDAMKSAGAAKKGGTAPISDVLDYPENIKTKGLNLLNTPGNDVESTTALAGAGANIILFTTGLGTPTGNPIVPVIKVSSNTTLFNKMRDIIDFDSGTVINGEKNIEEAANDLMDLILEVASGNKKIKAVLNQQYDFIPWKRGVSL